MPWGDDAAATFGTLCFGAGVALVGQMYHLPGDWPAGAMLVAIGAVIAAALTGKSGPLVIAFAAMTAWSFGRFDEEGQLREIHWPFFLLFVPAFALALGRENRLVAHAAVLALSVWLATLMSDASVSPGRWRHCVLGGLHGDRAAGAGPGLARRVPGAVAMGRLGLRRVTLL